MHTPPNELFDFDTLVDRSGTASFKWDKYDDPAVIPMWLADMDFQSPPAVVDTLHQRVGHGIFGYTAAPTALKAAIADWLAHHYQWRIETEWLVWLPSVVTGLNVTCRAVGRAGDAVMTTVPIYPPFLTAPKFSRRRVVKTPLIRRGDCWAIDLESIKRTLTDRTRLFLHCHPHNPTGRVFTRRELEALAEVLVANNVIICSDEIHCDLVLDADRHHIPTASLSPEIARHTITLMAPSKTFNLPGLGCAFAIIADEGVRRCFKSTMQGIVPEVNLMGLTAALSAYRQGGAWHRALIAYLRGNRDLVRERIDRIPGLEMTGVEATYLAWIDVHRLQLERPGHFFEKAGVGLADGKDFDGQGYVRLNFGCPRSRLTVALDRIENAVKAHRTARRPADSNSLTE